MDYNAIHIESKLSYITACRAKIYERWLGEVFLCVRGRDLSCVLGEGIYLVC